MGMFTWTGRSDQSLRHTLESQPSLLSFPEYRPPPGDTPKPAGHHRPCRLPALSEALPRAAAPRASTPRVPRSRLQTSRDRSSNPSKAKRALQATALRGASSRKEMRYFRSSITDSITLRPAIDTASSRLSVPNSKRTSARSALAVTGLVRVARCRQELCLR